MLSTLARRLILATFCLTPAATFAEPLDPSRISAESKWVFHFDMDSTRNSTSWNIVEKNLAKFPNYQQKLNEIQRLFNAKFPADLHDITVYGTSAEEVDNVVLVHATVDRTQVESLLSLSPSYSNTPHNSHAVLSWDDKGRTMYGAFTANDRVIVSQNIDKVKAGLDVLDKKSNALKADVSILAGAKPGVLIYLSGSDLPMLRQAGQARSPLLSQMKSAWLAISSKEESVVLNAQVEADNAQTAARMSKALEGIRAFVLLAAGEEKAGPDVRLAADIIKDAKVGVKESQLNVELKLPDKELSNILENAVRTKLGSEPEEKKL